MKKHSVIFLLSSLMYAFGGKASQSASKEPAEGLIGSMILREVARSASSQKDEELSEEHYLDKLFKIHRIFHQLPRDVQRLILFYLPTPFRPIVPKRLRTISHDQLDASSLCGLALSVSGKELFVCTRVGFFLEALDGSRKREAELFPFAHGVIACVLNKDHTKLAVITRSNKVCTIALDDYKIGTINTIDLPDLKGSLCSDICYTSDGIIIMASSFKEVVRWDPATNRLDMFLPDAPEGTDPQPILGSRICIHPKGFNVIFSGNGTIVICDLEKKEWKTIPSSTLNLHGEPERVRYNCDGSILLIEDFFYSDGFKYESGQKIILYIKTRLIRFYDASGDMLEELDNPIRGRNFGGIGFTPDNTFFYAGYSRVSKKLYPEGTSTMLGLYSVDRQKCLLCFSNCWSCFADPSRRYLVGIGDGGSQSNMPFICETDSSWADFGKITTLREYQLITYLQSIGYYGLTLHESHGLWPIPKYERRFSAIVRGPSGKELSELVGTYNDLKESVKRYLRQKCSVFIDIECSEEPQ